MRSSYLKVAAALAGSAPCKRTLLISPQDCKRLVIGEILQTVCRRPIYPATAGILYSGGSCKELHLCCGLQDQEDDVFLHIMKCATLYDMPKLLACCEYYVALSSLRSSHTVLRARCLSEQLLIRSWSHIAVSFCMAFQSLFYQAPPTQPCSCACCQQRRRQGYSDCCCKCAIAATPAAREKLSKFVASPKEFLKIAAADAVLK